jgi:hypothetical protein
MEVIANVLACKEERSIAIKNKAIATIEHTNSVYVLDDLEHRPEGRSRQRAPLCTTSNVSWSIRDEIGVFNMSAQGEESLNVLR